MASGDQMVLLPLTLFDFRDHNDAADARMISNNKSSDDSWRMSDDEVIGGYSRATFCVIQTNNDLKQIENGNEPLSHVRDDQAATTMDDEPSTQDQDSDFIPFVRWSGHIDTRIGANANVIRSGFCSIKSPIFPFGVANLTGKYNALEFKLRSDGRHYNINLYVTSVVPSTFHQAVLDVEPSPTSTFSTVILPFLKFQNVFQGRVQGDPMELDDGIDLENIGITLMDGRDGEFQLDLASIRAVNFYGGAVIED